MELIKTNYQLRGIIESRIGGRSENQDSYGYTTTPLGVAVVVCDGMGGLRGGRWASTIAVSTILNYLLSVDEDANPAEALAYAIKLANYEIIRVGQENPELAGMGTTVTALIINNRCATIAHVGDSRVYQFRGRQKAFRTFDHSMVFEMVKSGVLSEEQARVSEQSNIILRALGVQPEVEPEITEQPYLKGDRFLLCTDGFWGAMPEKEFIKNVTARKEIGVVLEQTAAKVDHLGLVKGGGHDNLTAAMVEMNCNSLMKVKMTKKVKIILAVLAALLVASVCVNVIYIDKYLELQKPEVGQSTAPQSGDEGKVGEDGPEAKEAEPDAETPQKSSDTLAQRKESRLFDFWNRK